MDICMQNCDDFLNPYAYAQQSLYYHLIHLLSFPFLDQYQPTILQSKRFIIPSIIQHMKTLMVMIGIILPSLCFHLCRVRVVSGASTVSSASTSYTKGSCFLSKRKLKIVSRSSVPSRCGRGRRLKK
jgi:hypothetical protein